MTATAAANVDKPTTASGAGDEAEVSGDGTVTTSSGATETTDTGDVYAFLLCDSVSGAS